MWDEFQLGGVLQTYNTKAMPGDCPTTTLMVLFFSISVCLISKNNSWHVGDMSAICRVGWVPKLTWNVAVLPTWLATCRRHVGDTTHHVAKSELEQTRHKTTFPAKGVSSTTQKWSVWTVWRSMDETRAISWQHVRSTKGKKYTFRMATRVSNMPCLGTNIQGVRNKKIKHIEILDYKLNFILLWYTLIFLLIQLYYIMSQIKHIIDNIFYTNGSIKFTLNKFLIVVTLFYRQKIYFFKIK
jgi:hypothetical protein